MDVERFESPALSENTEVFSAAPSLFSETLQKVVGCIPTYFPEHTWSDLTQICDDLSDSRHLLLRSASQVEDDVLHSRDLLVLTSKNLDVLALALVYKLFVLQSFPTVSLAEVASTVYAPLASRLGLSKLKTDLSDASAAVLRPEDCKLVSDRIDSLDRDVLAARALNVLDMVSFFPQLKGSSWRIKSVSSVLNKLFPVSCTDLDLVDSLHDLVGVRFIVDTVDDCYSLLAVFSEHFRIERFKDYIAKPKPNGYRSLHFVIYTPDPVEVQIRTVKDHAAATEGVFSHHVYKYGVSAEPSWLTEALAAVSMSEVLSDKIFVYTPAGKAIVLPAGATVLDFAYSVHTQVGHCARGAFVDGKFCSLSTPLRSEQQVQVVKGPAAHPSVDWLGFLVTSSAKAKVRKWLRDTTPTTENATENATESAASSTGVSRGTGVAGKTSKKGRVVAETEYVLASLAGPSRRAKCCNPTYPDEVRARVSAGSVVSHKATCARLLPSRQVDVWWIPAAAKLKTVTVSSQKVPDIDLSAVVAVYNYEKSTTYVYIAPAKHPRK